MKKATALFLVFTLVFSLNGCGQKNENDSSTSSEISRTVSSSEVKTAESSSTLSKTSIINIGGTANDSFNSAIKTSDGGYIATGSSESNDGDFIGLNKGSGDAIIIKFDGSENVQWIKNVGGSSYESFCSVIQVSDGGYIAVGYSESKDGDFSSLNKSSLRSVAILVKFDSSGNMQWVKGFSTINEFKSIVKTSDGGYITAGESCSNDGDFSGLNKGLTDAVVVKFDSSGNMQWIKDIGGNHIDRFNSIQQTLDGGYIAVGESNSTNGDFSGLNKGNEDAIIVKFDSSGKMQWIKDFGGTRYDEFNFIRQTSDGNYIAVGNSDSKDKDFSGLNNTDSLADAIIVKFDSSGNMQWVKSIGVDNSGYPLYDAFQFVNITSDGGYIAVGDSDAAENSISGLIVKFDGSGNMKWQKSIEKTDFFSSIMETSDGRYIAVGSSYTYDGILSPITIAKSDAILVKLDSSGTLQ